VDFGKDETALIHLWQVVKLLAHISQLGAFEPVKCLGISGGLQRVSTTNSSHLRSLSLRPDDLLTILKMALSIASEIRFPSSPLSRLRGF
jgi:hypothetical protein